MFKPTLTAKLEKTIDVPESDASITINYIKPGVMQDITNSAMKLTSAESDDSGGMKSSIAFNMSLKDRNIVRECMKGWTGFTGKSGSTLKFTQSALEDMMKESTEFVDFVVEEHEKYAEEVEGELEDAEKN